MTQPGAADTYPPAVFLIEEMGKRDWSAADVARQGGCDVALIEAVLSVAPVTAEIAEALARAFGGSAQYWRDLQAAWSVEMGRQIGLEYLRRVERGEA